jgi:Cd2+/Zn2+-exporting ATPase
VGAEAGVDEIHASLLPEDKVRIVDELRRRYGRVAMVGDGINDAPAMAEADLGIAMGAGGSDAAIEASDIALVSDDLGKLPWLVAHSKRTLAIVRQNIGFALGVKAVFFGLGLAGAASLWAAVAADMGASLLVVFNGLRLLGGGREQPARSGLYSRPEGAAGVPDLRASSGARPRQVSRSTASKLAR